MRKIAVFIAMALTISSFACTANAANTKKTAAETEVTTETETETAKKEITGKKVEDTKAEEQKATEKKSDETEIEVDGKILIVKDKKGTYYVSDEDGVNIRSLPSKKAQKLGCLNYKEEVEVTGFVYKTVESEGKETLKKNGWVRIRYTVTVNGEEKKKTGYMRNFLSKTMPEEETETEAVYEEQYYEDEYYDEYYEEPYYDDSYNNEEYYGDEYNGPNYGVDPTPNPQPIAPENMYCGYCGEYIGGVPHDHSADYQGTYEPTYYLCTLCGGWYEEGEVFRNHICIY